jgi:hypothetical protein
MIPLQLFCFVESAQKHHTDLHYLKRIMQIRMKRFRCFPFARLVMASRFFISG